MFLQSAQEIGGHTRYVTGESQHKQADLYEEQVGLSIAVADHARDEIEIVVPTELGDPADSETATKDEQRGRQRREDPYDHGIT